MGRIRRLLKKPRKQRIKIIKVKERKSKTAKELGKKLRERIKKRMRKKK